MADKSNKSKRRLRPAPSVRQATEEKNSAPAKPKRIRRIAVAGSKPFKSARNVGKKEYYLPFPDNKLGRFFNKRRYFIPKYFRNSFSELRQVKWPDRKQTTQLTLAVFVFALIFGVIITITDSILDIIFKKVLLK